MMKDKFFFRLSLSSSLILYPSSLNLKGHNYDNKT
jgi:hypothetical protein